MLYHQITSQNPLEIFLNLEELIFLSKITNQECKIKPNDIALSYFDIPFEIIDLFPENLLSFDISDYVCMYHEDFIDLRGAEFLSYRKNQAKSYSRLNKFLINDFLIEFSKPNYYETKYFTSDELIYHQCKLSALYFDIKKDFIKEYQHLNHILPQQPLLCLSDKQLEKLNLPFKNFYYTYSTEFDLNENFFKSTDYQALNLKDYLINYHESHKNIDVNMLICALTSNYSDIYGFPNDLLFGSLSKYKFKNDNWEPNLLGKINGGLVDNFHLKNVSPKASFDFTRKNLNVDRHEIMSLIRFGDCRINN